MQNEKLKLLSKEILSEDDKKRLKEIIEKITDDSNFKKSVWFMISEFNGRYTINMYYDNLYNKANGEGL